ncbi:hypothetical protein [Kitasatospora terrestris]|uniref:Uncharacterized protein n=1 Tax=Kitasatospora terrestris TaxID=258051 RepID=A0ABP9DBR6_9ACTN
MTERTRVAPGHRRPRGSRTGTLRRAWNRGIAGGLRELSVRVRTAPVQLGYDPAKMTTEQKQQIGALYDGGPALCGMDAGAIKYGRRGLAHGTRLLRDG